MKPVHMEVRSTGSSTEDKHLMQFVKKTFVACSWKGWVWSFVSGFFEGGDGSYHGPTAWPLLH